MANGQNLKLNAGTNLAMHVNTFRNKTFVVLNTEVWATIVCVLFKTRAAVLYEHIKVLIRHGLQVF